MDHPVVALVSELTTTSLAISNQMLTVLGTVLGLVISFRTSTAYERCVITLAETHQAYKAYDARSGIDFPRVEDSGPVLLWRLETLLRL